MQDIRESEFRDSGSITNTNICFEVRVTALRPHLHTEGFPLYVHTGPPTQGTSTEDLANTNKEYTTPLSNKQPLHKRDEYKPKAQPPLHLEGKGQIQNKEGYNS